MGLGYSSVERTTFNWVIIISNQTESVDKYYIKLGNFIFLLLNKLCEMMRDAWHNTIFIFLWGVDVTKDSKKKKLWCVNSGGSDFFFDKFVLFVC